MPQVLDGQSDFTGGMVDNVSPDRINPNAFSLGKNVELRDGGCRSRRGSWMTNKDILDFAGTETVVTGAGAYEYPEAGSIAQILEGVFFADKDETRIYRTTVLGAGTRTVMKVPELLVGNTPVRFVQGFGYVYALLGESRAPWRWDGDLASPWEIVPVGTSGAMPFVRDGIFAYNRLWLIAGDDTIYISDLLDDNFDTTFNSFEVDNGDGGRLNSLVAFGAGQIAFGKDSSCGVIGGASAMSTGSDLVLSFLHDSVGCISMDSMVKVGNDVMFADRTGVWSIALTIDQDAQLVSVPISDNIRNLYAESNWQFGIGYSASYYDNYFILSVSSEGSSVPNRLLAFDLLTRSWAGYWEFTAYNSPDTDGLYRHFRLMNVRISGEKQLLSIGAYGSITFLLKGDVEDFTNSTATVSLCGGGGSYATADYSEHNSGIIRTRFKAPNLLGNTIGFFDGSLEVSIVIPSTAFGNLQISIKLIGSGPATKWQYTAYVGNALFPGFIWHDSWHEMVISHDGTLDGLSISVDGFDAVLSELVTTDTSAWLADMNSSFSINPQSVCLDFVYISSQDATTTSPSETYWPFSLGTGTEVEQRTIINGTYLSQLIDAGPFVVWDTETSAGQNIESILHSRGFTFGAVLSKKKGVMGELYFAHGQPRLDLEINTDTPFDAEVFIGLTNKTYSLTAYEVGSKTAWTATNANDDFGTPFREDYSPAALGMRLGTNGFSLDVYRDRVESFSSEAKYGWAQIKLTNDRGHVRYSGLSLSSQIDKSTRDEGN